MPSPGQAVASKCPFLVGELGQNSSVVRQASLELQEDVQEMNALRKGKPHSPLPYLFLNMFFESGQELRLISYKFMQFWKWIKF